MMADATRGESHYFFKYTVKDFVDNHGGSITPVFISGKPEVLQCAEFSGIPWHKKNQKVLSSLSLLIQSSKL